MAGEGGLQPELRNVLSSLRTTAKNVRPVMLPTLLTFFITERRYKLLFSQGMTKIMRPTATNSLESTLHYEVTFVTKKLA